MKPAARQFHRAAMMALEHARQHATIAGDLDAAQVVLSLDYGLEMLLKAALLEQDQSIMERPGRSIGLQAALSRSGPYKQASNAEVLRERRDGLQHFAQYTDAATTLDLYEGTLLLVEEILSQRLGQHLPGDLRLVREPSPDVSVFEALWPVEELQRDLTAAGDTVVWAQGTPNRNALAVYIKHGDQDAKRLSPDGEFEYMPHTDGRRVACYRQSGGVVIYDLANDERSVISETGGPTSVRGQYVAAQGLGTPDGLGGGIWLYHVDRESWDQVSEAGDSARLTDEFVVWQELIGDGLVFRGLCSERERLARAVLGRVAAAAMG